LDASANLQCDRGAYVHQEKTEQLWQEKLDLTLQYELTPSLPKILAIKIACTLEPVLD